MSSPNLTSPIPFINIHVEILRKNSESLRNFLSENTSIPPETKIFGWTLLHFCAFSGIPDFIDILTTKFNLKLSEENDCGETALHLAIMNNHVNIVQKILEKGNQKKKKTNKKK